MTPGIVAAQMRLSPVAGDYSTATLAGQYGVATIKRVGVDVWTLFGALEAA